MGKAGKALPIHGPRSVDNFDIHAVENGGRRSDHRMMRSGEAEDAMRAAGVAGRQYRGVLSIVETKPEGGPVVAGIGG